MTVNISVMTLILIGGATLGDSPLNVIQLLWVNMVMDTLAALALATEPPHPTELPARKLTKQTRIVVNSMWRAIIGQSIYQILVMLTLLYATPFMFDIRYDMINAPYYASATLTNKPFEVNGEPTNRNIHYTFMFHTFMMMTIFNQINCRKLGVREFNIFSRFFNNYLFIIIIAAEFAASWVFTEFLGKITRTTYLPFPMVIATLSFGVGALLWAAIIKATPEKWLDKLDISLNEDGVLKGNDIISRLQEKLSANFRRSETERLLDPQ